MLMNSPLIENVVALLWIFVADLNGAFSSAGVLPICNFCNDQHLIWIQCITLSGKSKNMACLCVCEITTFAGFK